MCFIILFDLINKINIILYLKDLKLAPNHDLIIEVFTEVRNDLFPVDSLYIWLHFSGVVGTSIFGTVLTSQ